MSALVRWILRRCLGETDAEVLLSELEERHERRAGTDGAASADRWLRRERRRAVVEALASRLRRDPRPRRTSRPAHLVPTFGEGLRSVGQDLRFGARTLRKRPLFTAIAVGTLGLGIGAFTIVASLVEGVLLRDLAYEEPGELVDIWQTYPTWQDHELLREAWDRIGFPWPEFLALRENTRAFSDVAVYRHKAMTLRGPGDPTRLAVGQASSGLFPLLGVRPALGRTFLPGEEGPGAPRLVVLSHAFWKTRMGSDPEVLGQTLSLDGEPFEVIGVLPTSFRLHSTLFNLFTSTLDAGDRALWVPVGYDGAGLRPGNHDLEAMGRLAPGVTLEQARDEVDAIVRGDRTAAELSFRLVRPKDQVVARHRSPLLLLFAAAGVLLLVACGNVAALLVSESMGRRHELATRVAVGAAGSRITRQLLTESVLLGVCGSAVGIAVALVGVEGFLRLGPPLPRLEQVGVHPGVLLFAVLAGTLTGLLFGLAPAILQRRDSLSAALGKGGRSLLGGGGRFQTAVVAAELALTTVLLVTGGLLARSLVNLSRLDPGFDAGGVATVRVQMPAGQEATSRGFYDELLGRVAAIPGVEHAGAVDGLPFPGRASGNGMEILGPTPGQDRIVTAREHRVLPGYFAAMDIPLLAGRRFITADTQADAPPVMLINEKMARTYWATGSPLGARIRENRVEYEIVGIVGDVRERHLSEEPISMIYRPALRGGSTDLSVVVRTAGDPATLVPLLRAASRTVDPDVPLTQETVLADLVRGSTGAERYRTILVTVFSVLATLLASVGVFGVTARSVTRRNREMGIRIALGAGGSGLVRLAAAQTVRAGVVGIGLGVLGALAVARALGTYLVGIEAWDAPTYAAVALILGGFSVAAAVVPAGRVTRVQPMDVLREE